MRRYGNFQRLAFGAIAILMSPLLALAQDAEEQSSKTGVLVTMTVQQGMTSAQALAVLQDISDSYDGAIIELNQGGIEDPTAKIIAGPKTPGAVVNAIVGALESTGFKSLQSAAVSQQDAESFVDAKRYENISVRVILKSQGKKLNRKDVDAFNEMTIGSDVHHGGGEFSMMVADADEVQKSIVHLSARNDFRAKAFLGLEEYFRKTKPLGDADLVVAIPGTVASNPLPAIPRRLINDPVAKVFFLKQVDVTAAAKTIAELIPGSKMKRNAKLNSLWVETDIESMREITELLNEIDSPAPNPFVETKDDIPVESSGTSMTPKAKASQEPVIREPFSIFTLHNLSFDAAEGVIKKLLSDSVRVSHYPNHKDRMIAAGSLEEMQQLAELMKRIDPDERYPITYVRDPVAPEAAFATLKSFDAVSRISRIENGWEIVVLANLHTHDKIRAIADRWELNPMPELSRLTEPNGPQVPGHAMPPGSTPIGLSGPPHIPLGAPATGLSVKVPPGMDISVTPDTVGRLRAEVLRTETAIKEVAQLQAREKDASNDEKRTAIMRVVTEAFDVKQKLHQAELDSMTKRLERMKTLVIQRGKSKQKIIDRKVDEMMKPALQWEASGHP